MSFIEPEAVRLAAYATGLALALGAESLWPKRPWRTPRWKRLAFHGTAMAANAIILRLVAALPLALLAGLVREKGWGLAPQLGLTGLTEILATIVVLDLADYAWHRLNHVAPFFWRFHRVHHVDTHVDVTTALRFHPGELLLSAGAKATWILAWGPSIWGFAIFELLISLAAQYHHSNVDFPDRLERVLRVVQVTPRMHATHHSARTRSLNANYSTIFSVWDRIFGSYVRPEARHLAEQGLPFGRDRELDPAYFVTLPFRDVPVQAAPPEQGTADASRS